MRSQGCRSRCHQHYDLQTTYFWNKEHEIICAVEKKKFVVCLSLNLMSQTTGVVLKNLEWEVVWLSSSLDTWQPHRTCSIILSVKYLKIALKLSNDCIIKCGPNQKRHNYTTKCRLHYFSHNSKYCYITTMGGGKLVSNRFSKNLQSSRKLIKHLLFKLLTLLTCVIIWGIFHEFKLL